MAKKKPVAKSRTVKDTPVKKSSSGSFFRLLLQVIMIAIIVALLAVFWSTIEDSTGKLINLFGWGLVFIAAAILTLIVLIWKRRLSLLYSRWYRWLAAIAFILAVWGILSFQDLGGNFGKEIIAFPASTLVGVLRVLALFAIGAVLFWPVPVFNGIRGTLTWLTGPFKRQPRPRPVGSQPERLEHRLTGWQRQEKPPLPRVMDEPLVPPEVASSRKALEDLARRAEALRPGSGSVGQDAKFPLDTRQSKDARQVAADVWRKYGQAPNLVVIDGWRLPPIDILDTSPDLEFSQADNAQRARLIEEALASYGVEAKVVQINAGPTVTQFGVEPGWDRKFKEIKEKDKDGNVLVRTEEVSKTRVKVERITSLANDMALALAAPSIRIEAPVPGKSMVGIEVPNTTSGMVSLRGVIETAVFQKLQARTKLGLALGKGAGGEAVASDLTRMPHLLIAGATGSGKTVCLNTIICCLLMHNTPNDVRFILVDPKRVELTQYNSVPHLATPVIVDTKKAINVLQWLIQEMEERYKKFSMAGARHIEGYNKGRQGDDKLPYLVLVIDELADLMMVGFDDVESSLCRLAQLARATGIHLVVATQRPSVDVITGLIKANFPTRISFAVTSQVDSRTILDGTGAEKLLGRGDMLFMPTDAAKPKRLQGCFLSDPEIDRLVYFWGSQQKEEPDRLKLETLVATAPPGTIGGHPRDPLLEQAKELARQHANISTSFLQRRLHIGYPRAARLMEQLEAVLRQEQEEGGTVPDFDNGDEEETY
jgi:S-DNA-T family DNA segregation ATPase FtsK/SpoIIIE